VYRNSGLERGSLQYLARNQTREKQALFALSKRKPFHQFKEKNWGKARKNNDIRRMVDQKGSLQIKKTHVQQRIYKKKKKQRVKFGKK